MNKYLLRGLTLISVGTMTVAYSIRLMEDQNNYYKLAMSGGVIFFGAGIILTMYSLFRKIDRQAIQKVRSEKQQKK